ncbi:hypothetical protein [Ancylobacter amanitiformis]|uniref:NIPSNAP domain-containing protein n=1 Tax=Ancylobacter amanitiformis TaxID=217069 RepID=A0ABU0LXJ2_9HYPH|nr:hypothetical protein [Ancylobacter amanitiformis]MDQ0513400.1 hypothetical protein [Ancylobacter amanitiformis]
MIYTVECRFADPASEAEWNDFYSLTAWPRTPTATWSRYSIAGFLAQP